MSSLLKKLLIVALAAPTFAFAQTSVDKVVATVAGEPITAQQVQERITVNVGLVNRDAGKAVKLTKAQQDQIAQGSFNELIEERVLLNRAKTVGVAASDTEVNTALNNIAQSQNVTVDALKANVVKQGGEKAWAQFNRDLKNDMTIDALKKQEVLKKVKVTPAEIDAWLTEQKMGPNNPLPKTDVAEVVHIYVDGTSAASMKKIQAAKARIDKGEAFETVGTVSDRKGSASTPLFIPANDEQADPAIRAAVGKLAAGSVTDVVKTKNGLYLFKAISNKTEELTLDEQKAMATDVLTQKKAQEEYKVWYTALMENAKKNLVEVK